MFCRKKRRTRSELCIFVRVKKRTKMKITIVSGARPNFMKIAPIVHAIDAAQKAGKSISYRLVYTGKQDDKSIEPSLFTDLQMKMPDVYLGIDTRNNTQLAAGIMLAFDKELTEHPAQIVLVVDDLTATMSCAIVAKKMGLKVAHLVAGTRSFDMNMPKEVNRMITDGLSDYLFTAGTTENRNLFQTGCNNENVYNVGNILIDTIRFNRLRLVQPEWAEKMNVKEGRFILLTINRRKLLSEPLILKQLLETLVKKCSDSPVIAPVHTYVSDSIKELGLSFPNLHILPVQDYLSFVYLIQHAKAVVTDSGNVSEEATFFGTPCITLNNYAEHPETCRQGTNVLIGEDPAKLAQALDVLNSGDWKKGTIPDQWDGYTGDRIVKILLREEAHVE
jgi:UDP-N-acetylglucosamine 2-epimerase (non-hydrolysing)